MRVPWTGWLAGLALLAALGCSAIVDPDVGKLGTPPPPACTPRQVVSCVCPGGLVGVQVCNQGGSYDPCSCTGAAGSGGSGGRGTSGKSGRN